MLISTRAGFQAMGQPGAISYYERYNGPMAAAECRWYIEVKSKRTLIGSQPSPQTLGLSPWEGGGII
jgi:hypothetical protein